MTLEISENAIQLFLYWVKFLGLQVKLNGFAVLAVNCLSLFWLLPGTLTRNLVGCNQDVDVDIDLNDDAYQVFLIILCFLAVSSQIASSFATCSQEKLQVYVRVGFCHF